MYIHILSEISNLLTNLLWTRKRSVYLQTTLETSELSESLTYFDTTAYPNIAYMKKTSSEYGQKTIRSSEKSVIPSFVTSSYIFKGEVGIPSARLSMHYSALTPPQRNSAVIFALPVRRPNTSMFNIFFVPKSQEYHTVPVGSAKYRNMQYLTAPPQFQGFKEECGEQFGGGKFATARSLH